MKALITGGAGFVGRHLTERLLALGYEVDVVDNIVEGGGGIPIATTQALRWYSMDCRQFFYSRAATHCFYDEIFHLAAVVGGRQTIEGNPLAVVDDLSIDAAFFQWINNLPYQPAKTCYFSSSAAYPVSLQQNINALPLVETDINFNASALGIPDLTYGWSKLTGEYLASLCNKPITVFRPFSGYGADQHANYPFPSLLKRVMDAKDEIVVWGGGNQQRDFIYIEDCIDAIMHFKGRVTINLSTGIGTSFKQLIGIMCNALNKQLHIMPDTTKPEGVFSRIGSTQLQNTFGFNAATSLQQGIQLCLQKL